MPIKTIDISEVHTEKVQEIIGKPPPKILFRGNIIITVIVISLFVGAWFFRYPDIVSAPVTLSFSNPPVKLVAQKNGRISEIRVQDGSMIKEGDVIALIDDPANVIDLLQLKDYISKIDTATVLSKAIQQYALPLNIQVGQIQGDYAALYQAIDHYLFILSDSHYKIKSELISDQKEINRKIADNLQSKSEILEKQLKIEKWKDSVNKKLLSEKVISLAEYNEIAKNSLNQKIITTDHFGGYLQNEVQNKVYSQNIADLSQQFKIEENNSINKIREIVQRIRAQIAVWEKESAFVAPVSGRVSFFEVWDKNQYVYGGTPVFTITPISNGYTIKANLPIYKSGKVKAGQKVLIKLQEYPFEEFGMLRGYISSITPTILDSAYGLNISLDNGFTTTLNQQISPKPTITGTVDIITNNKNLLQRLFEKTYGKIYEK